MQLIREVCVKSLGLPQLEELSPPLRKLYYCGDLGLLKKKAFAIVGARNASAYGCRAAIQFAKEFSNHGFVVVSGLARGIDGAAHYGALMGNTPTLAVLGSGLDRIYPPEHRGLAEKIIQKGGLLLSEYPPGTPPHKHNFPMRNRILAGLGEGILVVQAREKSGSLITAQLGLELGKEVFVLPGQYDDFSFKGGHALVQEGAKLVQGIEDILVELPKQGGGSQDFWSNLFYEHGGTMTLEDIFTATHLPLGSILGELEEKKRQGEVLELFPQQYSWINVQTRENSLSIAASNKPLK